MGLPVEMVPEDLMYPQKLREMVAWLCKQNMPGHVKVQILRWWSLWVGIKLQGRWYTKVEKS